MKAALILSLLIVVGFTAPFTGRSQTSADAAWNARMAELEEERAAQAGVAVSIVFDDSGSMSERNKMTMAKQAFRAWVENAPASYRFGMTAINAGALVALKRDNKAEVLAAVDRLRARGTTPLADAIARTGKEIQKRRDGGALYERQVVVILTDGEDTTDRGIAGVQQEIRRLRAAQVEVVAFGYQGEGDYMRASATHYFSPENGQDIQRGLNSIAAEIGDTSDVVLDEPTRARMKNVSADAAPAETSKPMLSAAVTAAPTPTAAPARVSPPAVHSTQRGNGGAGKWVLLIFAAMFIFSRMKRR